MLKIANTAELQTELRQILAYAQTEQPSRERIARELEDLGHRLTASNTFSAELDALAGSVISSIRAKSKTLPEGDLQIAQELSKKLQKAASAMQLTTRETPESLYQAISAVRTILGR